MITNLFEKNIIKVLSFFLISPGSRYKRIEIKEKTQMNNIPLDIALRKLKSLKFIEENKNLYLLNFKVEENKEIFELISEEYKSLNLPYKIFNILVEISDKLSRIQELKSVILFGSYAKLIHTEKSDIDLAIILENKLKNEQKTEKRIEQEIAKISKNYQKQIELHFYKQRDIKHNKSDPIIKDILRNSKKIF